MRLRLKAAVVVDRDFPARCAIHTVSNTIAKRNYRSIVCVIHIAEPRASCHSVYSVNFAG